MIEATKQIYAAAPATARAERRPVYVPARHSNRTTLREITSEEIPPDGR
jgi:hypothetical protein